MTTCPNTNKTQLFVDGACHLCAFETKILKKADKEGRIEFVNIADPSFEPGPLKGRDFYYQIHARKPDGEILTGVDAFAHIYQQIPGGYKRLGQALEVPGLKQLAQVGYQIFAFIRQRLPKRQTCEI